MPTKLTVMNGSLALLGQPLLASDLDPNTDARTLRTLWDQVVEYCHEATAWDHAKLRVELARSDVVPPHGYDYYYTMPPDLMRLLTISNTGIPGDDLIAYEIESGARVATDADRLFITYVSNASLSQVGRWSATFSRWVSAELAYMASPKLNPSRTDDVAKEIRRAKSLAVGLDATQGPPIERRHGRWSASARGYGHSGRSREQR